MFWHLQQSTGQAHAACSRDAWPHVIPVTISIAMQMLGLRKEEETEADDGDVPQETEESEPSAAGPEMVPHCDHSQSRLTVDVTEQSSVFHFRLDADCSVTEATD